jgi:hypothetical protein
MRRAGQLDCGLEAVSEVVTQPLCSLTVTPQNYFVLPGSTAIVVLRWIPSDVDLGSNVLL